VCVCTACTSTLVSNMVQKKNQQCLFLKLEIHEAIQRRTSRRIKVSISLIYLINAATQVPASMQGSLRYCYYFHLFVVKCLHVRAAVDGVTAPVS
jgi:hypothetical protein